MRVVIKVNRNDYLFELTLFYYNNNNNKIKANFKVGN